MRCNCGPESCPRQGKIKPVRSISETFALEVPYITLLNEYPNVVIPTINYKNLPGFFKVNNFKKKKFNPAFSKKKKNSTRDHANFLIINCTMVFYHTLHVNHTPHVNNMDVTCDLQIL